jgi:aryl-alcohol dehydrogenase-like predicted oxidoreductase
MNLLSITLWGKYVRDEDETLSGIDPFVRRKYRMTLSPALRSSERRKKIAREHRAAESEFAQNFVMSSSESFLVMLGRSSDDSDA